MIDSIAFIVMFGVLGALAGASLPMAHILNKTGEKREDGSDKGGLMPFDLTFLPELAMAMLIGYTAVDLYQAVLGDFKALTWWIVFTVTSTISLLGVNAATRGLLGWQNPIVDDGRKSRIRFIVDPIAKWRGYEYGSEGYAWIWAAVKGLLITLPLGGFGALLFPLGKEAGSHADGRVQDDPNFYKEFLSYAGIGLVVVIIRGVI